MIDIQVPKLNNNDASYVVVQWLVDDRADVAADQPVVVIETSKATDELTAAGAGTLHVAVKAGAECAPGQVIGYLLGAGERRPDAVQAGPVQAGPVQAGPATGFVLTDGARALAGSRGITEAVLRGLG